MRRRRTAIRLFSVCCRVGMCNIPMIGISHREEPTCLFKRRYGLPDIDCRCQTATATASSTQRLSAIGPHVSAPLAWQALAHHRRCHRRFVALCSNQLETSHSLLSLSFITALPTLLHNIIVASSAVSSPSSAPHSTSPCIPSQHSSSSTEPLHALPRYSALPPSP